MRPSLALLAVFALVLLLGGCNLVDIQWAPHHGAHNHAFVNGFVDAGWPESNSLLKVGLFDGPSHGAILYLQIWKLLRFEVGFLGLALGVGPLDAGVGVFVYHPKPPEYVQCEGEGCDEECCEGAAEQQEDEAYDDEGEADEAAGETADGYPFVYDAY